ncbi:MAG: hypothetical protein LC641_12685, partial [Spirochaeta sp.]|nr:hypothetical protein [Spirochaeta sp.]
GLGSDSHRQWAFRAVLIIQGIMDGALPPVTTDESESGLTTSGEMTDGTAVLAGFPKNVGEWDPPSDGLPGEHNWTDFLAPFFDGYDDEGDTMDITASGELTFKGRVR